MNQPDNVILELGAMVRDDAAQKERDVDITIRDPSSPGTRCLKGIEVKAESRALDIIRVEQLCAKLNDMPDLSARLIVSAKWLL